jgi:hypothetical protein
MLISDVYVGELADTGEDSHLYQSKVLGRFPDIGDDALFPPRILQKAIDADLPGTARGGYGLDVARMGSDKTVVYRNRGGVVRLVAEWSKKDTEETADRADRILSGHGADGIPCVVDGVGVGAGVFDKLHHRGHHVIDFNGGERALDHDRFVNRRSEAFWVMRQDMDDGLVDLDPADK